MSAQDVLAPNSTAVATDVYWSMYYITSGRVAQGTRFTLPFHKNVSASIGRTLGSFG